MKTWLSILLVALAIAGFWRAGSLHAGLLEARAHHRLDKGEPLENAPPLVVFSTIALGGFTGMVADFLWIRASQLQMEGKYFELVNLSDWITKLEPRFIEGWVFHAWNLSYNVSVMFRRPEDRWRWVQHGLHLLRDQGLRYNPTDPTLHRELAWLYLHKIGGHLDAAHAYYKQELGRRMDAILHGPHPDHALRTEFRIDPVLMREVDAEFGPFDWRTAYAHAVYWLTRGLPHAGGFDRTLMRRLRIHAMGEALRQGGYIWNEEEQRVLHTPNLDILPNLLRHYAETMGEIHGGDTFDLGLRTIYRETILGHLTANRPAKARALHDELLARFPDTDIERDFELYVAVEYLGDVEGDPSGRLMEAQRQSYLWRALDDADRADGYAELVRICVGQLEARHGRSVIDRDALNSAAADAVLDSLRHEATRARLIAHRGAAPSS